MPNKTPLTSIQRYIKTESAGGLLLLIATILALIVVNSPLQSLYNDLWHFEIGIHSDHFTLMQSLIHWINDGFMAIFFFLVGLEIKREILIGELNTVKKALLPVFAAVGGMILPMSIFLLTNKNDDTTSGWGIPMATDIAFSLAVLQLLGKRVPIGLKIFLTAFAIIDDMGAVLVIALFYTHHVTWTLLMIAFVLLAILYLLSYLQIHNKYLIFSFGIAIWLIFLKAGIHPTIAGILLAFAIPIRQKVNEFQFAEKLQSIVKRLTDEQNTNPLPVLTKVQIEVIDDLEEWTSRVQSPLQLLEHRLHYWIAFVVMPIFAFANAGISLDSKISIDTALAFNLALALMIGKIIGVFGFTFAAVKLRISSLPENVNFKGIFGVAILSGLGFTMSLFIANLAFLENDVFLNSAKIGIVSGSVVAGIIGYLYLAKVFKHTN